MTHSRRIAWALKIALNKINKLENFLLFAHDIKLWRKRVNLGDDGTPYSLHFLNEKTCCRDQELANKAFKEAQVHDPLYIGGWVGQALLAEQTGFDVESMDLFRHTTSLGNDPESSIGYANWICK